LRAEKPKGKTWLSGGPGFEAATGKFEVGPSRATCVERSVWLEGFGRFCKPPVFWRFFDARSKKSRFVNIEGRKPPTPGGPPFPASKAGPRAAPAPGGRNSSESPTKKNRLGGPGLPPPRPSKKTRIRGPTFQKPGIFQGQAGQRIVWPRKKNPPAKKQGAGKGFSHPPGGPHPGRIGGAGPPPPAKKGQRGGRRGKAAGKKGAAQGDPRRLLEIKGATGGQDSPPAFPPASQPGPENEPGHFAGKGWSQGEGQRTPLFPGEEAYFPHQGGGGGPKTRGETQKGREKPRLTGIKQREAPAPGKAGPPAFLPEARRHGDPTVLEKTNRKRPHGAQGKKGQG